MVVHTVEFVRAHYKIGIQFLFPFKKVRSSNSLHGNRMKVTKYLFKIRICVLQQVFIASACIIFRLNGGIPDEPQRQWLTVVMWCDEQSVAGFILFISIPQNSLLFLNLVLVPMEE